MTVSPIPDEIKIWKSFRSGDEKALEYLIRTNTTSLTYYGRKMVKNDDLIQDCIQDTFIELWKYKNGLKDLSEIKPYLFTCLRRKIIRALKKEVYVSLDDNISESLFEVEFSIEEKMIQNENESDKIKSINIHINKLSKRRKEIIYLKFYENLSNEEIASVMGIKYQTATNLLHEALNSLRNIIPSQSIFSISLIWSYFIR